MQTIFQEKAIGTWMGGINKKRWNQLSQTVRLIYKNRKIDSMIDTEDRLVHDLQY